MLWKVIDALLGITEFVLKYVGCTHRTRPTPTTITSTLYPNMFVTVNEHGDRVIFDGEALDYECKECGHKFERLIGYGGCCPSEYARKLRLEKDTTICPECSSRNVKRVRRNPGVYLRAIEGRELEEWED